MSATNKAIRADRDREIVRVGLSCVLLAVAIVFEVSKVRHAGYMMLFPLVFLVDLILNSEERIMRAQRDGRSTAPIIMTGVLAVCTIGVDFSCMVIDGQAIRQLILTLWITVTAMLVAWIAKFLWLVWEV